MGGMTRTAISSAIDRALARRDKRVKTAGSDSMIFDEDDIMRVTNLPVFIDGKKHLYSFNYCGLAAVEFLDGEKIS